MSRENSNEKVIILIWSNKVNKLLKDFTTNYKLQMNKTLNNSKTLFSGGSIRSLKMINTCASYLRGLLKYTNPTPTLGPWLTLH